MNASRRFLITGGAGFIGSAVVRHLIRESKHDVLVVDKLTYAGNLDSLAPVANNSRYAFVRADIADAETINQVFASFRPHIVMHLAAESHVDRSIDGPADSSAPTSSAPRAARGRAALLARTAAQTGPSFRFHHVSTDEVFGSLGDDGDFRETTAYDPSSPYSASKAASDHLVRAWHHTYGLPVVVTNCSNNYGPYQFPEKLIPLMIINGARRQTAAGLRQRPQCARLALRRRPRPRAGRGRHARRLGRDLLHRRRQRADEYRRWCSAICGLLDELRPTPASAAATR